MNPCFDLAHEPWIPVRYSDGNRDRISWRDVVVHSPRIVDIDVDPPIAYPVLIRLATALVLRSQGAPLGEPSLKPWKTWAVGALASGVDPDRLDSYLTEWTDRFWLLHPDHPFLQESAIATECPKTSSTNKLRFDVASGNNFLWWSKTPDAQAQLLDHSTAAIWLLAQWGYGAGGRCAARNGKADGKQGPLRPRTQYLPRGANLWQTLLVCTAPAPGDHEFASHDRCWWELPTGGVAVPGQLGRLTASPRGMLLHGDDTGISDATVTVGSMLDDDFWESDRFTSTRRNKDGATSPYRLNPGHLAWAEAPALLAKLDGNADRLLTPPPILDSSSNPLGATCEFFTSGISVVTHFADKSKDLDWARTELPGLLAGLETRDRDAYQRIYQYCHYAAEVVAETTRAAGHLIEPDAKGGISVPDIGSFGRQLWMDAEIGFWRTTRGAEWETEAKKLDRICRVRFDRATDGIADPRRTIAVINTGRRLGRHLRDIEEKFGLTTQESDMTQSTQTTTGWPESLERFLRGLRDNKGALADLRSGRGRPPEECQRMHRWVAMFVSDGQVNTGRERAVYTTAALFAAFPTLPSISKGLGGSLHQLRGSGRFSEQGIEARLLRLARSPTSTDLCRNLPPVVSLIATAASPLSWTHLARDIDGWDFRPDRISRQWLRDLFIADTSTGSDTVNTEEI